MTQQLTLNDQILACLLNTVPQPFSSSRAAYKNAIDFLLTHGLFHEFIIEYAKDKTTTDIQAQFEAETARLNHPNADTCDNSGYVAAMITVLQRHTRIKPL